MDRIQSPGVIEYHHRKELEKRRNAPEPEPEEPADPVLDAWDRSPLAALYDISEPRQQPSGIWTYDVIANGQAIRQLTAEEVIAWANQQVDDNLTLGSA